MNPVKRIITYFTNIKYLLFASLLFSLLTTFLLTFQIVLSDSRPVYIMITGACVLFALTILILSYILKSFVYFLNELKDIIRNVQPDNPESDHINHSSLQDILKIMRDVILEKTSRLDLAELTLEEEKKQHREAEAALTKSEVLFQQFWEISVDGMRLTDEQGKIIAVNDAFCRIVEMSKENLMGQLFPIIYDRSEHDAALKIYEEDLRNNALKTHFEAERQLWNNKKVWIEFSNSFIELDGTGKIVLSVINDISERKNAEIEVLKNEKRYRMLFNNGNDAVFVNHLSTDNKFESFIEVNDVACLRLAYSREELLNMNLMSTIPERYHPEVDNAIDILINVNHVIFEVMQARKDKRLMPVEISAHLFEFDNRPTVLSIIRDITKRKRSEKQLQLTSNQLRNLASRLQDIREEEQTIIAREIHDELGQVLTVLKIQVSLIANKLHQDQKDLLEKTEFVSETLDQMVETVQKITSKLRPGILDELGLIPAIEWQAQEFQKRTGIICDCSILIPDLELERDKTTAIFRILQEALTNIARHAQAKKLSIILREENNILTLEVTDNGRGIRESRIDDQGSLGILGMKERALVLGGIVDINGVPGKGTHVKVKIPMV